MAFIRFTQCSVGKKICQHCDTIFERTLPWQGGGEFTAKELVEWARPYRHICLTGGEPLNQEELIPLLFAFWEDNEDIQIHVETSGTVPITEEISALGMLGREGLAGMWICVSPKPGFRNEWIEWADEIKVIVPGLGEITTAMQLQEVQNRRAALGLAPVQQLIAGDTIWEEVRRDFRWPSPADAIRWAAEGRIVFLQPRNGRFDIDKQNLMYVMDFIRDHPELRLSMQTHKLLKVQ